jgi:curved DNA-binding protein CbpA
MLPARRSCAAAALLPLLLALLLAACCLLPCTRAAAARKDPYSVLGVARGASADDIRAAYRRTALKFHPDKNPKVTLALRAPCVRAQSAERAVLTRQRTHQGKEHFLEAQAAYELLSDDDARRDYDRFGFRATAAQQQQQQHAGQQAHGHGHHGGSHHRFQYGASWDSHGPSFGAFPRAHAAHPAHAARSRVAGARTRAGGFGSQHGFGFRAPQPIESDTPSLTRRSFEAALASARDAPLVIQARPSRACVPSRERDPFALFTPSDPSLAQLYADAAEACVRASPSWEAAAAALGGAARLARVDVTREALLAHALARPDDRLPLILGFAPRYETRGYIRHAKRHALTRSVAWACPTLGAAACGVRGAFAAPSPQTRWLPLRSTRWRACRTSRCCAPPRTWMRS